MWLVAPLLGQHTRTIMTFMDAVFKELSPPLSLTVSFDPHNSIMRDRHQASFIPFYR